jgi:hypothetical protein
MPTLERSLKLLDFNIYDNVVDKDTSSGSEEGQYKMKRDLKKFTMQMFGINEIGETFCLYVSDYKPFFYVKVDDDWNIDKKCEFLSHIKSKIGKYYENSICECKIIKRRKLYGFDGGKEHKFVLFKFENMVCMNKVKNLYYQNGKDGRRLKDNGYIYQDTSTYLYEANIPPLLRYFHIKEISPSGWISIPLKKATTTVNKMTSCKYEYDISNKDIISLNNKETIVPYKICSFDIEASSSHGDFPIPKKSYKKLSNSIMEYSDNEEHDITRSEVTKIIKTAFGYDDMINIDKVYPKSKPSMVALNKLLTKYFEINVKTVSNVNSEENTIEKMFERMNNEDGDDEEYSSKRKIDYDSNILDMIHNKEIKREDKIDKMTDIFKVVGFPELEGDKVTFIGSTFLKYGDEKPYLNNCVVLDTCSNVDEIENSEIVSYKTERIL